MKLLYIARHNFMFSSISFTKGEIVNVQEFNLVVNKGSWVQFINETGYYLRMKVEDFNKKFKICDSI